MITCFRVNYWTHLVLEAMDGVPIVACGGNDVATTLHDTAGFTEDREPARESVSLLETVSLKRTLLHAPFAIPATRGASLVVCLHRTGACQLRRRRAGGSARQSVSLLEAVSLRMALLHVLERTIGRTRVVGRSRSRLARRSSILPPRDMGLSLHSAH